jgi:hypothetical protein
MATRRTPDPTRSPKPAAAATKPAKAPTDAKPTDTKKAASKPSEPKATVAGSAGAAGALPGAGKATGTQTAAPPSKEAKGASSAGSATPATPAKRPAKPKASKSETTPARAQVSEDTRRGMIAEAAYLRAERRGFAPGHENEDWCAAEKEVDALLNANTGSGTQ